MANKVPKFTVSHHKQQRNAFDLSQSHIFQAEPGALLPILCLDLIPDDNVKINVSDFVKSMPVVNSPLCSARGVYEFFFVPYHQLWHNFDQFITQMNDYRSTYFSMDNPPSEIPHFGTETDSSSNLKYHILSPSWISAHFRSNGSFKPLGHDVMARPIECGASVISDFLGYCPSISDSYNDAQRSTSLIQNSNINYQVNPFRFAAYQKIYQDYY